MCLLLPKRCANKRRNESQADLRCTKAIGFVGEKPGLRCVKKRKPNNVNAVRESGVEDDGKAKEFDGSPHPHKDCVLFF